MKHFIYVIIITLFWSCGSSKKIAEKTNEATTNPKTTTQLKTEPPKPSMVVEDESQNTILPAPKSQKPSNQESIKDHELEAFNHDLWSELLQKYVTGSGKVNYMEFKHHRKTLQTYITSLTEKEPNDNWKKEDKLAYWINAYNALTVDLILQNYPLSSIKDIDKPWDQRLWQFGDKWLNLNDIEHQILRKMDEPRIHFAIVCASESCPKLQNFAFTAKDLEQQLVKVTKEFLVDVSKNEISENSLKLSKIFKWFAKDFKANGTLIDFLNQYSEVKIAPSAKKSFKTYDWVLNE